MILETSTFYYKWKTFSVSMKNFFEAYAASWKRTWQSYEKMRFCPTCFQSRRINNEESSVLDDKAFKIW